MKPLKFPSEDKEFNIFNERLVEAERKFLSTEERDDEETDSEKESKCAELRHERVMKLAEIMGYEEALNHWRDGITAYELDWELEKALRVSPEIRYQRAKEYWNFHEISWTARGVRTGYDGYGCNGFTGCVPECRFYPDTGRIEDSEIIKEHEERNKKYKERREAENKRLGLNDNDNDDVKRQKWQQIRELKSRILDLQLEYLHRNQHTWQSTEELKAIETAVYNDYYNSKNSNSSNSKSKSLSR